MFMIKEEMEKLQQMKSIKWNKPCLLIHLFMKNAPCKKYLELSMNLLLASLEEN